MLEDVKGFPRLLSVSVRRVFESGKLDSSLGFLKKKPKFSLLQDK